MPAVIIVPEAGSKDSKNFLRVGQHLRSAVYGSHAMVFQAVLAPTGQGSMVNFLPVSPPMTKKGSVDFFVNLNLATTFICVSHNGEIDGPIMGDRFSNFRDMQPWHTNMQAQQLWMGGAIFWTLVGRAKKTTKILLLGCNSGNTYAKNVHDVAHIRVFGFKNSCSSADSKTMEGHVGRIENTGRSFGMVSVPAK